MKTAQQKQQDEIGIFLSMTRKKNGLAQKDVAKVLGHGSQNFVSRIEKGKAIVPIGKIRDFADAYHLPFFPFGRLVLSSMHPEAHEVFSMILNAEPELGRTAKRCHVKDAKARKERIKLFDSDMKADALAEVRHFLEKNKIFISKSKRTIFENEKNETGLISLLLSAFRQRYGLSQDTVAQRLGYTGPQLVSRIEAGKSPIPLIKINEFATAYEFAKHARMSGVRLEPFARVVLADMHPETYRAFMDFLKHDQLYAKIAKECHVDDDRTRRKLMRSLSVRMKNEAFTAMRSFFNDNLEMLPNNIWSKRAVESTLIEDIQ